jgi:hypothetical protein
MNSLRFLALLFIFSGAVRAQDLAQLIQQIEPANLQPGVSCPEEQQSCVERFMGGEKSEPQICESYRGENSAFLQRFPDGSVVVNPVAVDEALEYMDEDNSRAPAGSGKGDQSTQKASSGTSDPEPRTARGTDPELRRMISEPTTNPGLLRKMNSSLAALKAQLREQIVHGQSRGSLSAQQNFLLNKLDHLHVTMDYNGECETHPFNASYSGVLNTLNMCPFLSHLAPESYLALLAHELGHMIDPCSFFDNHSFSPEIARLRNNEDAQKALLRQQINRCLSDVPTEERTRFANWATAPSRMANQGITVYRREPETGGNRDYAERLQRCGVVQAPRNPAPSTYEGSPYLPIISCVSQSVGRAPITGSSRISEETCNAETTMPETIADYVASSVIARMIKRTPATISQDRRSLVPNFYSSVSCGGPGAENYLSNRDRMNLFLQPVTIQHAVQCEGSGLQPVCAIPSALTE